MLTFVIVLSFFIISFVIKFFGTFISNAEEYWGGMLIGDYNIISSNYKNFKILNPPGKDLYFNPDIIKNELYGIKNIVYSKRLRFGSFIEGYKSEKHHALTIIGGQNEENLLENLKIRNGNWPSKNKKEISLFYRVADILEVSLGDSVILYCNTVDGYMNYDIATISGIVEPIKTNNFIHGYYTAFVPYNFAKSLIDLSDNKISEISIRDVSYIEKQQIRKLVENKNLKLVDMWESDDVPQTMKWLYYSMMLVVIILIIGVIFSSLFSNISIMTKKRYREIGVYLSYGAEEKKIFFMFYLELTIYLIYCSIFGIILSILLTKGINLLDIRSINMIMELIIGARKFEMGYDIFNYIYTFLILWCVTLIAAIIPLIKGINDKIIVKLFRQ